jgi:hypothetical protein
MSAEREATPLVRFVFATGGAAVLAFPALAAVNSAVLDGRFTETEVALASVALALPVGVEFLYSARDPYVVGRYVGTFVVLLLLLGFGQGLAALLLGRGPFPPLVEFVVLLAAYVGAYALVTSGAVDRFDRDAG